MTSGGPEARSEQAASPLAVASLDRYARIVSRALDVPVAAVTFIELDRQVRAGAFGLSEAHERDRTTPLSHSFCKHVVADREPLVVEDSRVHPMLKDNLASIEDDVIAYAGWPISDHTGEVQGALCAIDREPRRWTAAQIAMLRDLAEACSSELGERGRAEAYRLDAMQARARGERDRGVLRMSDTLAGVRTLPQVGEAVEGLARRHLGATDAVLWLLSDVDERLAPVEDPMHEPMATSAEHELALVHRTRTARWTTSDDDAVGYLPLVTDGSALGVLAVTWQDQPDVPEDLRDLADALARYCSLAAWRTRSSGSSEGAPPGQPGVG